MSMMAETYMLQALQNGLASVQSSPALLADILTALNPNELASAQQWFGNAANKVNIAPGFPNAQTKLPFIGVTVADESQIDSQTPIGLDYYTVTDTQSGTITQARGARFNGSLKATIYTPNADFIIWLSAVCKWALLSQFDWFVSDNGGGLNNLRISMGDYEPQPAYLPTYVFTRGVFLSAEYDSVFTVTPSPITSDSVTGTFSTFNTIDES